MKIRSASFEESFLGHRRFLWAWICAIALILMSVVYYLDRPVGGRSGGTLLGYAYGTVGALGILYLMYFGIRKRTYYASATSLKGILSSHVWIGLALLLVVPLHCAFQFGWNVHTLTYVLMVVVILSGIWGVMMYRDQPHSIRSQRGGGTIKQLLEQVRSLSTEVDQVLGLTATTQKSDVFLKMLSSLDFSLQPSLWRSLCGKSQKEIDSKQMAALISKLPEAEREEAIKLIRLVNKKRELANRIQSEVRAQTFVKLWLYFHLPVSFALLAALFIHIFSVFYFW